MKQIEISLDNPQIDAVEKQGDKEMLAKVPDPWLITYQPVL